MVDINFHVFDFSHCRDSCYQQYLLIPADFIGSLATNNWQQTEEAYIINSAQP